jgi:uncharacterized peroxidase-related enzyme
MTDKVHALDIATRDELTPEMQVYFAKCDEKLGFVPNVLKAYAFDRKKLDAFVNMSDELMLASSGVSRLEREMISVVVSAINHCFYCVVAHSARVRQMSGDERLGDALSVNYRVAEGVSAKHRAMLDFAAKMTEAAHEIEEPDRAALRAAGWSDADIWDIAATASFYNMSNRMASAIDLRPNAEYHAMGRKPGN